ncbi:hypothetical protein C8R44DRAFT_738085 [Mycena epipterygia]|nr:hypothetical protein C8R44DRAFT_738085 [Mycena epipterygia]
MWFVPCGTSGKGKRSEQRKTMHRQSTDKGHIGSTCVKFYLSVESVKGFIIQLITPAKQMPQTHLEFSSPDNPHPKFPTGMQMFAQPIVDENIVQQTAPVYGRPDGRVTQRIELEPLPMLWDCMGGAGDLYGNFGISEQPDSASGLGNHIA